MSRPRICSETGKPCRLYLDTADDYSAVRCEDCGRGVSVDVEVESLRNWRMYLKPKGIRR